VGQKALRRLEELADEELAVGLARGRPHLLDALDLPPAAELEDLSDARAGEEPLLVDVPAPVRQLELERVEVRGDGDIGSSTTSRPARAP
jgi:hypothetical protein